MTFSPLTKEKGVPMEEYDTPDELYMYQKYNEVCYTYNDVLSALQGLKDSFCVTGYCKTTTPICANGSINIFECDVCEVVDKWFPITREQE